MNMTPMMIPMNMNMANNRGQYTLGNMGQINPYSLVQQQPNIAQQQQNMAAPTANMAATQATTANNNSLAALMANITAAQPQQSPLTPNNNGIIIIFVYVKR